MEALEGFRREGKVRTYLFSVDTSGRLKEGDNPGKKLDASVMPRRPYLQYWDMRDLWFGIRFSY